MMLPEPLNKADEELAAWKDSMSETREAEAQLDAARRSRDAASVYRLHIKVSSLRTRSDLLLAHAVEKMRDDFMNW
jgi:hypothetical protein